MFGFLIGFLSLIGLIAVVRSGRRGACGAGFHGHGHHGWRWRGRGHGHPEGDDAGPAGGTRAFLRFLFQKLDTTSGQEKEIAAAVDELIAKTRELRGEGRATRDDVAKLLRTESLDETLLADLFTRHDDRLRELQKAFSDALGRIHLALDPKQREQLAALLERGHAPGFGGPYRGVF
jgi:uncharacterized membrane protein